jgi:hypothetical protein
MDQAASRFKRRNSHAGGPDRHGADRYATTII